MSEDDAIVLEDEGARVVLKGDLLRTASLSTGAADTAPYTAPGSLRLSQQQQEPTNP